MLLILGLDIMRTITAFDTKAHHIYLRGNLFFHENLSRRFKAVLDTGASKTEFSTDFLIASKILTLEQIQASNIRPHQETQKIGKILIPCFEVCGQKIENFEVFVSHFESFWAMDALIGLDFFRKFRVSIDCSKGELVTEEF